MPPLPPAGPPAPPMSPPSAPPVAPACVDQDFGATDRFSDGCESYIPDWCGMYDEPGFLSKQMCCACGGGSRQSPPASPPLPPAMPPFPPSSPPPLRPGHVRLPADSSGDELAVVANDSSVIAIELEPSRLYNVTTPLQIKGNLSIMLAPASTVSGEQALIEVDFDGPFATLGPGASLKLIGLGIGRPADTNARRRRRRRLTSGSLLHNTGGSLLIDGCLLRNDGGVVLYSAAGDVTITDSFLRGRVYAAAGRLELLSSSFDGGTPLLTAAATAELVVGPGNSFNFSGPSQMAELIDSNASTLTYACNATGGCQLVTVATEEGASVCPAGSSLEGPGDTCELCTPGKVSTADDTLQCTNCSAGRYQKEAGKTACEPCPLGHACVNGSAMAQPCAAGTYADVPGLGVCKECEGGRHCAAGSLKGLLCDRGSYCPPGASLQEPCPAGRFGEIDGLNNSRCSGACAKGHYCGQGAIRATEHACLAGTFNDEEGLTAQGQCKACNSSGHACPAGAAEQTPCPAGRVALAPNQDEWDECDKCAASRRQLAAHSPPRPPRLPPTASPSPSPPQPGARPASSSESWGRSGARGARPAPSVRKAPARPPSARQVDTLPSWAARRPPSAGTVPRVARARRVAWSRQCAAPAPSPTKPTRPRAPSALRARTSPPRGRRVARRALPAPFAFAAPRCRARAVRAPTATSLASPISAAAFSAPQAARVPQAPRRRARVAQAPWQRLVARASATTARPVRSRVKVALLRAKCVCSARSARLERRPRCRVTRALSGTRVAWRAAPIAERAPRATRARPALSSPRHARPAPTPTRQSCHSARDARPEPTNAMRV